MLASKGLRWSGQAVWKWPRQSNATRQFSSFVRHMPSHSKLPLLSKSPFSRARTSIASGGILSISHGSRFASTVSPTPIPPPSATPAEAVSSTASNSTIPDSAFSFEGIEMPVESLYDIPESIGYLKALGLDFGWGVTASMQWLLEHIHIYAGTPWWVSIGITAVVARVAFYKLYVGAAENGARLAAIQPITSPITAQMTAASQLGDRHKVMELRGELSRIHARAGVEIWKSFMPFISMLTGYGTFILLRAMAKLPVPGLETGGTLWFYDLTIPDPFYILPVAGSGVLYWVMKRGGENGVQNASPQMQKFMMYGMPALSFAFTFWLPAALQFSFFIAGIMGGLQATLLRQTWFRRYHNMTPLPETVREKKVVGLGAVDKPQGTGRGSLSQAELNSRFQKPAPAPAKPESILDNLPGVQWVKDKQKEAEAKQKEAYLRKQKEEKLAYLKKQSEEKQAKKQKVQKPGNKTGQGQKRR